MKPVEITINGHTQCITSPFGWHVEQKPDGYTFSLDGVAIDLSTDGQPTIRTKHYSIQPDIPKSRVVFSGKTWLQLP